MGEAFRRKRAAAFQHQRSGPYQAFLDQDLLRACRATETCFEVSARLSNNTTALVVGSRCVVFENGGEYDVVHGNIVIAQLPAEAKETIAACKQTAPSLNGIIPCCVSRVGAFGGVSLKLHAGDDDGS